MSDEFMDTSEEEGGSVDGGDEQEQKTSPPTNSMAVLERRKQKETRQFASRLLADINSGTINGVQVKREAGNEQDGATANNAEFVPPRASDVVKKCLVDNECFANEVCYPIGYGGDILLSANLEVAKKFAFKPDPFQQEAIKCLDQGRNLVVSAHTSSGKTLIGIYAVALALKAKKRAIYTTPIKALSNQKYKELAAEFPNIGLMTGDVCINPNAECLVMTTEILRNKLYQRDPEILKNLEWVIFDEIHYMQDKERGVVWEESIILLPQETKMVFLSATIPNASEFAKWIAHFRQQLCHLIYTVKRPIPLIHFIFPSKSDQLFKIVQNNRFMEDNFGRAMEFLTEPENPVEVKNSVRKSMGTNEAIGRDNLRKLIRTVHERNSTPCLVFSFSRMEVEECAQQIKQMDFNSEEEKSEIRLLFENSIRELSDEERNLDQISQMLLYFLHGIGVHHSGLLPIIKEIVELLFAQGLIKVLIATETFAMGVNMPAKTVIFTSARKFDGQTNRWLTNGEYVQMSGRAGRRDQKGVERGIVILMTDQQMEIEQAKEMMMGPGDRLESKYRLTFNMILNQIRINPDPNTLFPQKMLANTFLQWQSICSQNSLKTMREKKLEWESMVVEDDAEEQLKGIQAKMDEIERLDREVKKIALVPHRVVPFLNPGRLFKIKHFEKDYDWGVLVDWEKVKCPVPNSNEMIYILHMAVMLAPESVRRLPSLESVRPPGPNERAALAVVPFTFECIRAVSKMRLKMPEELLSREAREALASFIKLSKDRFGGDLPELHPKNELHACEPTVTQNLARIEMLEEDLSKHPLKQRQNFDELFNQFKEKKRVEEEYKKAKERYEECTKLVLREELQQRLNVLSALSFIYQPEEGPTVLTKKGLVACEICSGDELVLTEILFNYNSPFHRMDPSEIAAILSCFVFDETAYSSTKDLSPLLRKHFEEVQVYIQKMAKYQQENGIKLDANKYLERFSPGLINVVYKWCEKQKLEVILEKTQIFEGSIVRCFRRLDQLLVEMIAAAKVENNCPELAQKFAIARRSLRRGTPFISSLYT